jgi:hypothetical protein
MHRISRVQPWTRLQRPSRPTFSFNRSHFGLSRSFFNSPRRRFQRFVPVVFLTAGAGLVLPALLAPKARLESDYDDDDDEDPENPSWTENFRGWSTASPDAREALHMAMMTGHAYAMVLEQMNSDSRTQEEKTSDTAVVFVLNRMAIAFFTVYADSGPLAREDVEERFIRKHEQFPLDLMFEDSPMLQIVGDGIQTSIAGILAFDMLIYRKRIHEYLEGKCSLQDTMNMDAPPHIFIVLSMALEATITAISPDTVARVHAELVRIGWTMGPLWNEMKAEDIQTFINRLIEAQQEKINNTFDVDIDDDIDGELLESE